MVKSMILDASFFISILMLILLSSLIIKMKGYLLSPNLSVRESYRTLILILVSLNMLYVETIIKRIFLTREQLFSPPVIMITFLIQYFILSALMLLVLRLLYYRGEEKARKLYSLGYISFLFTILGVFIDSKFLSLISILAIVVFMYFIIVVMKKSKELRELGYNLEAEAITFFLAVSIVIMVFILGNLFYQRWFGKIDVFLEINLILSSITVILLTLSVLVNPKLVKIYAKIKEILG